MNELLFCGTILLYFTIVLLMYRFFGVLGLFVWLGFSTVVSNIEVLKTVEMFGLTATLGNVMYGSTYLVTDILNEKYGQKLAKRAVYMGFFTFLVFVIIMQIVLVFTPGSEDIAQGAMETLFGVNMPRILLGSLTAYLVSQNLDVILYSRIRKRFPAYNQLWIRSNGSTLFSQLVDTLIFTSIAFLGTFPTDVWIEIFISTYLLKLAVTVIETPFMYIAKNMKPKEYRFDEINE